MPFHPFDCEPNDEWPAAAALWRGKCIANASWLVPIADELFHQLVREQDICAGRVDINQRELERLTAGFDLHGGANDFYR